MSDPLFVAFLIMVFLVTITVCAYLDAVVPIWIDDLIRWWRRR